MAEMAGEQTLLPRVGVEMRPVVVPRDRMDDRARRDEMRSLLIRLLVALYVERHQELEKDAA